MKPRTIVLPISFAAAETLAIPAFGHHSNVGFAVETVHTANGVGGGG